MFAVLQIEKEPDLGLFGRLWHRLKRRRIQAETVDMPFGRYLLLTAYSERIDWDKVAQLAGRGARELVLPRSLEPPEGGPVRRYVPDGFLTRVLLNTCIEVIRRARIPLYRKVVTLVDRRACYTDYVPTLLCHCITVCVVTADIERYEEVSEQMMEELGASILVSENAENCGGSMLVIAPDEEDAATVTGNAPVLTLGNIDRPAACRLVGDLKIRAHGDLARWLPKGVDPADFAGALTELGGWEGTGPVIAESLRCKGNRFEPEKLAFILEQNNSLGGNNCTNPTKRS